MRVERHESALGFTELAEAGPDPRLRPFVASYMGFTERTPRPLRRRELPTGVVPIIVSFGLPWELTLGPGGAPQTRTSFVAGLTDSYATSEHAGAADCMQFDLTPLGAQMFLGLPPGELTGHVIEFADVIGPDGARLVQRLAEAPGWAPRFALLEQAIVRRLADARAPSREVAWAWWRLVDTDGAAPVGDLARELGWSHKRLITRFREQIGLPPKRYARLLRFGLVVDELRFRDEVDLAELALRCGYYDQAHFNRDFRAFAGTTPTDALAERLPGSTGFAGD